MEKLIQEVDVLAIGAHPDDVEIGAGGFVALMASQGKKVGLLDLTRGEMGTRGTPEQREEESSEAARLLGASFRANLGLPDSKLFNCLEYREKIAEVIRQAKPRYCLTSYFSAKHPDHSAAGELVQGASWIAGLHNYESKFEAHRPSRVFYYPSRYEFKPSFVVDVTEVWEKKKKAVRAFKSQFFQADSNEPETEIARRGFFDMIEARARGYGRKIGAEFAEPFFMFEETAIDDPDQLLNKDRF
jgi:bacillithiol biosynthesis deacetylase BshB1